MLRCARRWNTFKQFLSFRVDFWIWNSSSQKLLSELTCLNDVSIPTESLLSLVYTSSQSYTRSDQILSIVNIGFIPELNKTRTANLPVTTQDFMKCHLIKNFLHNFWCCLQHKLKPILKFGWLQVRTENNGNCCPE